MASTPTRLPDDLYGAAPAVAAGHSRSTAQQIAHWARIGREFEGVSVRDVEAVLKGHRSHDDLTDREQAMARIELDERLEQQRRSLDLEAEFRSRGITSWVSADEDGNVVMRGPDHDL